MDRDRYQDKGPLTCTLHLSSSKIASFTSRQICSCTRGHAVVRKARDEDACPTSDEAAGTLRGPARCTLGMPSMQSTREPRRATRDGNSGTRYFRPPSLTS